MPYFFHLGFELYPSSTLSDEGSPDVFLPSRGTNIFGELPVHQVSAWATRQERKGHKKSKSALSASSSFGSRLSVRTRDIESGNARASSDWRFDRVSVQSIDMMAQDVQSIGRPRGKSVGDPVSAGGLATKGRYVASNPKNTELGWGVVHLYRDSKETPGLYDDGNSSDVSENCRDSDDSPHFKTEDCTTLCILAVPSYMTPSDLLGFVGEQTREEVSHFRLIRTSRANKYMVLMKFREAVRAKAWQKEWNGKLFNSMEPENCHVVFVKSIEFENGEAVENPSSFPDMTNDPFSPGFRPALAAPTPASSMSPTDSTSRGTALSSKPLAPPTPALVEMPTCPVCLERMDETTGLLTILCQHVFHCACLEKWRGSGCPVCRYTQNDTLLKRGQEYGENECSVCGSSSNLWICLICGNIGCGRYDSAHAFAHYEATSHSYAMDIATQHVWDYAGDGYVHRLIQTKADGKLMDLPAAYSHNNGNSAMTGFGEDTVPREKLDNMGMEYALLLTSQLDSQRLYFQEQVERAVDKATQASIAADKAMASNEAFSQQFKKLHSSYEEAQATMSSLEKDVHRTGARAERAETLARSLGKDLQAEKTMNEGLMQKIGKLNEKLHEWEVKAKELDAQKKDLEEQIRDLTFFISSSEKLKQQGVSEDVVEGKLEVPVAEDSKQGKKKKGKGKK